tara:strand:- start:1114 stop:3249 length:2136 start_codon:yes stop_codon:yes gene_type:complete
MPVKKLTFRPGVNRENTRYANENGWYECNNVRFRQGSPEKIGGWKQINSTTFDGIARSLHNWITLTGQNLIGVGTNLKFVIENGGAYNDVTPIRTTTSAGDVTFSASNTTLSADVTSASATTIAITDATGFPISGKVLIGSEIVDYTGITDNTLTGCTRGASKLVDDVSTSTTAATHSSGAAVTCFTILVTDSNHGATENDFVTFSGAATLGGNFTASVLNQNYQVVAVETADTYTITAKSFSEDTLKFTNVASTSSDSGNGGSSVVGAYELTTTATSSTELTGWGAGGWGAGPWSSGEQSTEVLRLWAQTNFGEDLIFGPRGGRLYYWDASVETPFSTRAVELSTRAGASDVPVVQNNILVSDINRFVFCFGTNSIGSSTRDPMLIRWSDQESAVNWTPAATNQAGSLRLSRGTEIVTASQARQEVLVWTDSSLYSLQYVGIGSGVWGAQLVGEKISIASQNSVAYANGVAYWMGTDKFYQYDGRTRTLPCDIRRYIFTDINAEQYTQVFGGSNEGFNEVWWFYCSANSSNIDRYVIYNYAENIWYYGNMARSAWLDSGLRDFPLAATYNSRLVNHEEGVDDNETGTAAAISSFITSAEFDLDDGHQFMLTSRMVPDVSFEGSTASNPVIDMTLFGLSFSGSGFNDPASESGVNTGAVTRTATSPVEVYTTQIHTRVRGRQMAMKIESSTTGVQWQLGSPRIDVRPDGRR